MTANDLKKFIIENNHTVFILEKLGCHGIKPYDKSCRCGLPNHNNKTSVVVVKDTLSIKVYKSDSGYLRGDIITLCMDILNISFPKANKLLHELLGLKYGYSSIKKNKQIEIKDPLSIFTNIRKRKSINVTDIELIDNEILNNFLPYVHIEWIREGILPSLVDVFGIGYSLKHKRIIIPHRLWCGSEDDYAGIIGRTTIKEWELLDIPKYFPIKSYEKSLNLYGLQENYKYIQEAGYVVVYEAEKSPLKRFSRGDRAAVAICGHCLSPTQIKILIGLNVEIIIAYDEGISIEHIRKECNQFYGLRKISYMYDKHKCLLDTKESPADKSNKIFEHLFKYRTVFDDNERKCLIDGS